jgi:hypothetical protein
VTSSPAAPSVAKCLRKGKSKRFDHRHLSRRLHRPQSTNCPCPALPQTPALGCPGATLNESKAHQSSPAVLSAGLKVAALAAFQSVQSGKRARARGGGVSGRFRRRSSLRAPPSSWITPRSAGVPRISGTR